ncbi:poly(glycerol-phosphate) alpha-glucosyltransferase [Arthrobacter pascens]|uniref:glycosyltransferase n=1 Tax=Arthrobacter pascens TaxID=1677 RepID=UPI002786470D|nr:glycosyltransferase [Arthrobacter pascens]MDQ0633525.1 poly(glycerol-phosphate) alpha-glucosyltransferase [Arthrobacter pascens]
MQNRIEKSAVLPAGKHFAVTWSVPVVHGGRTNAMLHRSRAFVAEGGAQVEILTFDNFRDYKEIRKTLTEQRKLVDGVTIRNIWEDLPDLAGAAPALPLEDLIGFSPLGETGTPVVTVEGGPRSRTQRFSSDGTTLLQTDYLREDGTLFLSDRSDVDNPGVYGGRSITLCNGQGLPVEQWRSSWEMYRSWLDHLTEGKESFFIVDNKHAATFMKTYRRPTATVMLMVHDSHLATAAIGPASPLSGSGEVIIPRLDSFDGVVILTRMQAEDIKARVGDIGNAHVIPNSRAVSARPRGDRNPTAGVLLAQLRPLKQIDHAIRAITDVNHRLQCTASLAIYGEGAEGPKLESLIARLGVSSLVQLKGHTHSPAKVFAESSFSLLTSSSESFGLVILESMSAGCIPIAYDVHYGPSSIITHGVNGYIVEYGNERALAECVAEFLALPAQQQAKLREAAISRAADFSDEPVVSMWSQALTAAATRKALPSPEVQVAVTDTAWGTWSDGTLDLRVTAHVTYDRDGLDTDAPGFSCRIRSRGGELFFRVSADTTGQTADSSFSIVFRFTPDVMQAMSDSIADATLETQLLGRRVKSRLPYSLPAPTRMEVYGTVHGNLSLRPVSPPLP